MRTSAILMLGTAAVAFSAPSFAQTTEESVAQAANTPEDAQGSGDVIIVTATKRASTVQDVPFSINAQTEEDIQRANATTIEDISKRHQAEEALQQLNESLEEQIEERTRALLYSQERFKLDTVEVRGHQHFRTCEAHLLRQMPGVEAHSDGVLLRLPFPSVKRSDKRALSAVI